MNQYLDKICELTMLNTANDCKALRCVSQKVPGLKPSYILLAL